MKKVLLAMSMIMAMVLCSNAEVNIENMFEARYQAWKEYCSRPEVMALSYAGPRFTCNEFKEIVDLGLPALPYIAKKMEQDSTENLLWKAIEVIAKVRVYREYDRKSNKDVLPDFPSLEPGDNIYLYWWREGHKQTPNQFSKLYSEWKQLKQIKDVDAQKIYQRMVNLGIPVIPYMIREIKNGDSNLIPAISYLTDGEIKEDASPEECINWWANNKEKWTIKFGDIESNESAE